MDHASGRAARSNPPTRATPGAVGSPVKPSGIAAANKAASPTTPTAGYASTGARRDDTADHVARARRSATGVRLPVIRRAEHPSLQRSTPAYMASTAGVPARARTEPRRRAPPGDGVVRLHCDGGRTVRPAPLRPRRTAARVPPIRVRSTASASSSYSRSGRLFLQPERDSHPHTTPAPSTQSYSSTPAASSSASGGYASSGGGRRPITETRFAAPATSYPSTDPASRPAAARARRHARAPIGYGPASRPIATAAANADRYGSPAASSSPGYGAGGGSSYAAGSGARYGRDHSEHVRSVGDRCGGVFGRPLCYTPLRFGAADGQPLCLAKRHAADGWQRRLLVRRLRSQLRAGRVRAVHSHADRLRPPARLSAAGQRTSYPPPAPASSSDQCAGSHGRQPLRSSGRVLAFAGRPAAATTRPPIDRAGTQRLRQPQRRPIATRVTARCRPLASTSPPVSPASYTAARWQCGHVAYVWPLARI